MTPASRCRRRCSADEVYGRDRTSHVVAILTPPDDKKVTDKAWQKTVTGELDQVVKDHPDQIVGWVGWLKAPDTTDPTVSQMKTAGSASHLRLRPAQGR